VLNNGPDITLVRLYGNGTVDHSFQAEQGGVEIGRAVVIQGDGKIVVAGSDGPFAAVSRYDGGSNFSLYGLLLTLNEDIIIIFGGNNSYGLDIVDNGARSVSLSVDRNAPVIFTGIDRIVDFTGDGNDDVSFLAPDGAALAPLPDFLVKFGNGHNTFNLTANISRGNPGPWKINVIGGVGGLTMHTDITGSAPINLIASLGDGPNNATFEFHGITQMPTPERLTVNGGRGVNNLSVVYDYLLPPHMGTRSAPIEIDTNGHGKDLVNVEYNFHPTERMPATFNIPLVTSIHDDGYADVHVSYNFFTGGPGWENEIIAILAPISAEISGTGIHSAQVYFAPLDFTHAAAIPMVEIDSALTFDIHGGNRGSLLGLLMGNPDLSNNPELMSGGSLNVRLTGGKGANTIKGVIALDRRSTGHVKAMVIGGVGGINDLTLDIFGIGDPDQLKAVVIGGVGDVIHSTPNVRVINRDD
jgi:hypothetical protein